MYVFNLVTRVTWVVRLRMIRLSSSDSQTCPKTEISVGMRNALSRNNELVLGITFAQEYNG